MILPTARIRRVIARTAGPLHSRIDDARRSPAAKEVRRQAERARTSVLARRVGGADAAVDRIIADAFDEIGIGSADR